ncbi:uncharacterized protein H6S33_009194 [Morchella sextelata]|uniref:uncharacterized protein n=1 Tax=Morchella sextelata TaxID=1174677 RepID=UPI001D056906|nr:uncharacterized protein H6S33_009194 [Morchella sextelata]KAH0612814.1 hypothetical protein H6S33_009194 [Morchella sextelata]
MNIPGVTTAPREGSDKENDTMSSFNTIDSCAPQRRARKKRKTALVEPMGKRRRGVMDSIQYLSQDKEAEGNSPCASTVNSTINSSYRLPSPLPEVEETLKEEIDDCGQGTEEGDGRLERLQELDEELQEELYLRPDTLIADYRILRILGHGNFSTTYLAEITPTEPEPPDNPRPLVAIKRMKQTLSSIGENEYSLLEFLHSNGESPRHVISPITSFFDESHHFHLVIEPLDSGRPVALPLCGCGHPQLACPGRHLVLAKIMLQLLSGLLSLHTHNLIHADLTPANILFLPESNRIKLIDLGNTIRPEDRAAYLDDFGVQSACYRAPEILLGAGPLSRVMDVWSAGVIAVEMLLDGIVVGNGIEGGELLRGVIEGRGSMVERVVELVGSVREYQHGMYWQDIYSDISLHPAKKKRGPGNRKRRPEEKTGMLKQFLETETEDSGLVKFLMAMMEVGVSRRGTVMSMLRHPWLIRTLLGDWERVLTGEMEEVESIQDQSEVVALQEEQGEEEDTEEDLPLPGQMNMDGRLKEYVGDFFAIGSQTGREPLDATEQSTDVLEENLEHPLSSPSVERSITPFYSSPPMQALPVTPPPPSLSQSVQDLSFKSSPPLQALPVTPPSRPLPASPPPPPLPDAIRNTPLDRFSPLPAAIVSNMSPYNQPWQPEHTEITPPIQNIKIEIFSSSVASATFQLENETENYKREVDTYNSAPETSLLTGDDSTTRIFAQENLLSSPPSSPVVPLAAISKGDYRSSESKSPSPVATVGNPGVTVENEGSVNNVNNGESLSIKEEASRRASNVWDRDLAADMASLSEECEEEDAVLLC